jgi:hypothetical protein
MYCYIIKLQEILLLEQRLTELKLERLSGVREIDVIDKDIRVINDKINILKKTHINYFYYF